ncbi:peptidoglycan-binding protein [Dactylosporangium siamense]|uniref:Peptidoglycan-binding protein n=1 Tax=Dactylosporangium siamense TaxID=685454 RepID=A0A919PX89_9ACTN|nr:peptidoglycan-binding protein [Dactylosporangium siamense]
MAGVALAGVAGTGAVALFVHGSPAKTPPSVAGSAAPTAAVTTTDVARRQSVVGTLGRSGTYTVIAPGGGTLTWLPAAGAVVGRGKPAYEVDGRPVILLFGDRPPWRPMQSGMTDGADVRQLEDNLKALGYGAGLTVDSHFSSSTYWAVRRWQKDSGLPVTGTVPLGQVVFVAGTVRIAGTDRHTGEGVEPGATVAHGTGEQRAINVQVTTSVLAKMHVGDTVVVNLPDDTRKTGTVTTIGAVTQPQGSGAPGGQGGNASQASASVVITLTGEISGIIDNAQVDVGITVESHRGVLAVPVPALRSLPAAAYEVWVADGSSTRHVAVRVGIFDQVTGLVEVSGAGLAAGQRVVVPANTS